MRSQMSNARYLYSHKCRVIRPQLWTRPYTRHTPMKYIRQKNLLHFTTYLVASSSPCWHMVARRQPGDQSNAASYLRESCWCGGFPQYMSPHDTRHIAQVTTTSHQALTSCSQPPVPQYPPFHISAPTIEKIHTSTNTRHKTGQQVQTGL